MDHGVDRRTVLGGMAGLALAVGLPTRAAAAEWPASSKRGFAGSDPERGNLLEAAWSYDWLAGTDPSDEWNHDEYVPMINGDDLGWTAGAAEQIRASGADAMLGYNEPDHEEGYTDVQTILDPWRIVCDTFRDTSVTVVGPSIKTGTSGGQSYLQAFMDGVESDSNLYVDAVGVHWYADSQAMESDPVGQADAFLDRMDWVHEQFGLPIWITEFGGPNFGSVEDIQSLTESNATFLSRTIPELERREYVRRYAWWSGSDATWLTTDGADGRTLTDVGEAYVTSAGRSAQPIAAGTYRIVADHSGHALTVVDGSTDDGANVAQAAVGAPGQRWTLSPTDDGAYTIEAAHSGHVLEVANEATDAGETVDQWPDNGEDHQRWHVIADADDTYRVENANSRHVLDVSDGATDPGTAVLQWPWIAGSNQRWRFEPAEEQPPALDPIDGTIPQDPDGDGVHEDINADGSVNFPDVNRFFQHTDSAAIQDHPDAYDFTDDGTVDLQDVLALFEMV
ncbi:MAG: RICIN domain-containing protein [Halococcoides sp.]